MSGNKEIEGGRSAEDGHEHGSATTEQRPYIDSRNLAQGYHQAKEQRDILIDSGASTVALIFIKQDGDSSRKFSFIFVG